MKEDTSNVFGDLIKEGRLKMNLSLRNSAKKLEISAGYLSTLETNKIGGKPSEENLKKISKLYKISIPILKEAISKVDSYKEQAKSTVPSPLTAFRRIMHKHGYVNDEQALKALPDILKRIKEDKNKK